MAPLGHDGKLPQRGHHEDAAADSWTTRSGRVPGSSRWPGSNGPSFPYGVDVEGALKKINNFILDKRCRCCCLSACKCDSRGPRGGAVTFCGGCVLSPGRFMFYSSVMSLSLSLSLARILSVKNILGINHEYVMRLQSFTRSSRTVNVAKTHARARTPRAGGSRRGLPATWGLHQARGPLGSPASSAHLCLHSLRGSWLVSAVHVNPVQPGGRRARGEQLWLRAGGGPRGGATAGSRIRHPLAASGERSAQRHTRRVACPYVHARGFPATTPGRRGRSTPSHARAEALLAREARASPAVGARVAVGGSLLWTGRRSPIASASVFKASRCAEPLTRSP